jgi:hypothetical protein
VPVDIPGGIREAPRTLRRGCMRGVRGGGSREAAHVQRMLSESVAETTVWIACLLAKKTVGPHRVTMLLAGVMTLWSALRNRRLQPGGSP